MARKVLCSSCGSTVPVGSLPMPPKCPVCNAQLPFTLPRTWVYIGRTLLRPVAILLFLAIILVVSLHISPERKTEIIDNLGHFITLDIFRTPHAPPK